ncbi:MAG: helix-turn-helix transcriptional regulator [Prevotellaceae bacterium]|jgi:DNA-binding Xre family transcriptional regulator|nr:helix-turn-helix transcriptional regulator [Prevotellaceae bacterium]
MKNIHIGKIIYAHLLQDGHSVSWLARKINCERTKIYRIFNSENIDTDILERICIALNYNFFLCLSNAIVINDEQNVSKNYTLACKYCNKSMRN